MRCLTLAAKIAEAPDSRVLFVSRRLPGHAGHKIQQAGFSLVWLPADGTESYLNARIDAQLTAESVHTWLQGMRSEGEAPIQKVDWLVVDHYGLDHTWERAMHQCSHKILAFVDLNTRKHCVEAVLNQNSMNIDSSTKERLFDQARMFFLGSRYAMIRDEFLALRDKALEKRHAFQTKQGSSINLLINIGAGDYRHDTHRICVALSQTGLAKRLNVTVLFGCDSEQAERCQSLDNAFCQLTVLTDSNNMAELMLWADVAIGACGSATWERCVMALPSIISIDSDHQLLVANTLREHKAATVIDTREQLDCDQICSALADLIENKTLYANYATHSARLCKGQGPALVAQEMLENA